MQPAEATHSANILTALERLESGQPYMPADAELILVRQRARRLTREYNATGDDLHLLRNRLLASLFGALGDDPDIEAPLFVEYGRHVFAGDGLVVGPHCVLIDAGRITIGNEVRLGPAVHLYAVSRPLRPEHRKWEQAAEITIGDGVWIGGHSVVNPNVTIGSGSTIAPGSVVIEDIPAGVYAGGNPCRIIREL
jgi:maltose O-acetyltransferase